MEFDLKNFFKEAPRFKEEVKQCMHDLAKNIVIRATCHFKMLNIDRILPRHVRIVIFQMAVDPLTRCNRTGLCVQQMKIKNMMRIFQRVLDDTDKNLQKDARYGLIDKKIVKGTCALLEKAEIRFSSAGAVCLAACVAEVCGIILNATQHLMQERTITQALLQTHGTTHRLSNGQQCTNASLLRFLHSMQGPHPEGLIDVPACLASTLKPRPSPSKMQINTKKAMRRMEEKNVSFDCMDKRPRTSD